MKNSKELPLSEYPRMQLVRDSYMCLNGEWDYVIKNTEDLPKHFLDKIIVPFSPEAPLSKVNRILKPDEYLIYRRFFNLPNGFNKGRVFLHFTAVDQSAKVYLNNHYLGEHIGGFLPFSFEIQEYLKAENELVVIVQDQSDTSYHSRGKQKIKRGGIWYTPQSGIYLPVWLESTPNEYISSLKITPLFDDKKVEIIVKANIESDVVIEIEKRVISGMSNTPIIIDLDNMHPWTVDDPYLYKFKVRLKDDEVASYFGMRKISIALDERGKKRFFLNNKPLFQSGLLDQGYYQDGLLTPPSDKDYIDDIMLAKKLGFNMLRKHIKIEAPRWYYHCDRLGILVWQDFVNGGSDYSFLSTVVPVLMQKHSKDNQYKKFGRLDQAGREEFINEARQTIDLLYNSPAVVLWTIFNEGWGQFDAEKVFEEMSKLDPTRLFDHASGWHDQGIGAIKSDHVYFRKYKYQDDKLGRARILSEFGGYQLRVDGHAFNDKNFGYKRMKNSEQLTDAFIRLYEQEIVPAAKEGLAASVYTQLSDVEDELNGLVTYDRQVIKVKAGLIRKINYKLTKGL
ncbi:MAG: glycoside hydrolase family 2 TIM barrel-domain containing protein [Bacilli bacterium]|nr:glycoside hydrolase family 2 TIM barrel-domain containing protein [Bacilli bacterium]